jgi:hypothetical protein
MANVTLIPQPIDDTGADPVYTTPLSSADTYFVRNDGRVFLHFKKTGAGNCTLTIVTPGTVGGLAIADRVITVPATVGDKMIGPFPRELYNDGNNDLTFTLNGITGLSVAVIQV